MEDLHCLAGAEPRATTARQCQAGKEGKNDGRMQVGVFWNEEWRRGGSLGPIPGQKVLHWAT